MILVAQLIISLLAIIMYDAANNETYLTMAMLAVFWFVFNTITKDIRQANKNAQQMHKDINKG